MSEIIFDRKTINEILQQRFILPTYQRDYKWEAKQVRELIGDLQEAFLANFQEGHGRKEVAEYDNYFLGTIITTKDKDGSKTIIDGQQRITTVIALLTYFYRQKQRKPELGISDFVNLIKRDVYGVSQYNVSFEGSRKQLFDILMDSTLDDEDIEERIDSIHDIDPGSLKIFDTFKNIDVFLDPNILNNLLPNFIDYMTEKVLLFEIVVPSEQDAHKVFVTMNDRGLKLGPMDLLKGYLLSNILDDGANKEAHARWVESTNKLKSLGPDEDATFLKVWLRSKYADTARGKNKGDAPRDFELIGDSYHRWVIDNKTKLGLISADKFEEILSSVIPKYVDLYVKIRKYENQFSPSYAHLFYNGARNLTLQPLVVLASIKSNDTSADIDKKIKGVSAFLDYYASVRIFSGKDNTYDNIKDYLFAFSVKIRDKSVPELKVLLSDEVTRLTDTVDDIISVNYNTTKRYELLHVLARIGNYIEEKAELTNSVGFPVYIDRYRSSKTFDVEHILTSVISTTKTDLGKDYDFAADAEYHSLRDNIGGLILLPRGRNRSLKDKAYSEKLNVYATENILASSLHRSFYQNNPQWNKFSETTGIAIAHIEQFNREKLLERQRLYYEIAHKIWNKEVIEGFLN